MRLDGPIRYVRLLKVLDAGKYGIKIETTKNGKGIEKPGAEVVVLLTVVNDVKKPKTFRHLLLWREKWWHNGMCADYSTHFFFHLEPIEEARPRIRRAVEWVVKNVRLLVGPCPSCGRPDVGDRCTEDWCMAKRIPS